LNLLSNVKGESYPLIARQYKAKGLRWVVVGDENYGGRLVARARGDVAALSRRRGDSREELRAYSRNELEEARRAATHFRQRRRLRQGEETDHVSIVGLSGLAPKKNVDVVLHHARWHVGKIVAQHTLTADQIGWFKAGSALNLLAGHA
jgi:aconitate hydratase